MFGIDLRIDQTSHRRRWITLPALLSMLLAVPVLGTVRTTPKIRMSANPKPAQPGKEYQGVFEIDVPEAGAITDLMLKGRGWKVHSVQKPPVAQVVPRGMLRVPFRATPDEAEESIELSFRYQGHLVTRSYRIGPKALEQRGKDRPAVQVLPGAAAPAPAPAKRVDQQIGTQGAASTLRFAGRIVYTRPQSLDTNNMPVGSSDEGADGIRVEVKDEDTVDSETIWTGLTDPNGYFDSGNISWDDCDVTGCDDPDLYVRFVCDTGVVNVLDPEDDDIYAWSTIDNVVNDFTGSFHNFGTLKPLNMAQMPALHIHNSITRVWRYIAAKNGTGIIADEVDVLWPDGDNAFYDPSHDEIHVSPFRQWHEASHTHEFGHHFLETYSVNPPPVYCNGYCDTSPQDCGHCQWCQETDHDAWNEGWPNWLADIVTRDYPLTYVLSDGSALNALRTRSQEALGLCGTGDPHDALRTEGFVGALLRDIDDGGIDINGVNQQDDHDGDGTADCDTDAMWLGPEEIFTVVVQDKPSTVAQFIQMFRDRYPLEDQDLWSTARNVSLAYSFPLPTPQPTLISNGCGTFRAGQRIELKTDGHGSLLHYQWRRNPVNLSDGGRISGVTTATLVIDPSEAGDGGAYSCLVSTCDNTLSYPTQPIYVHIFPAPGAGMVAVGFGRNDAAQTGRGFACTTPAPCASMPQPVVELANFADMGGFEFFSLAVMTDGFVWGWGDNSYRQATGNPSSSGVLLTPTFIPQLSNMVSVDAGNIHGVALRTDGKVFCWGYNGYYSLGVPNPSQTAPVNPAGLECMIDVQAGNYHTVSLKSDGTVWAWGMNGNGQLGRGFADPSSPIPLPVLNLSSVIAITASGDFSLALKSDGTVWSWGRNYAGQLGDGTTTERSTPVQVTGLSNVVAIAASPDHSMAVLADGSARVWGSPNSYKLGNNAASGLFLTPITPIGMTANVIAISGGWYHTLFLKNDRTLWACGANASGQLAQLAGATTFTIPTQITGLSDVRAIFGEANTNFVFTPGISPSFTSPLTNQNLKVGASLSWNAPSNGTLPKTYQWKRGTTVLVNGGPISGATATLTINPVSLAHAGTYTCTVTNGYGSAAESAALTVNCIDADLNCDEHVDTNDVQVAINCRTRAKVPGPPAGCSPTQFAAADLDNDGDSDADDFGRFQRCVAGPNQIPSPNCAD